MEVNGTTQNNDGSNFSENQTLEPSDDQGSMMVSNESQNISGDGDFSVSNSSSNVNNTLNSEPNVSNVLDESGSLDTDAMLIQSPKLLKNANITSTPSSAKGPDTTDTDNIRNFFSGGSFLKNLFEINGPAYQSINELLEKYPYLPYYSLLSLLTASTGRESVERMLEWMRQLQAKQVATTEELIKSKDNLTEKQFLDAESDDYKTQANACAGIARSGGNSDVDVSAGKCGKVLVIIGVVIACVVVAVVTAGVAAGVAAAAGGAILVVSAAVAGLAGGLVAAFIILSLIGAAISFAASKLFYNPSTKAKVKEYCDLLNPVNALAEIIVIIAELFKVDEEKLKWVRLIARIIFAIAFILLACFAGFAAWGTAAAFLISVIAIAGAVSALFQVVQSAYTLSVLKKQEDVAKKRLGFETAIAHCEKLQKDLDIIASEIDMIVELFTASMDRVRAEYDRISRMIKETSDVKNMIARNIGA